MAHAFDPAAAARFIADAHHTRQVYRNLPAALAPQSVADAYTAQEALRAIWAPQYGPVAIVINCGQKCSIARDNSHPLIACRRAGRRF